MPGPPPKRNARRRNARPDWVQLPASGRAGQPPAFPINPPRGEGTTGRHPDGLTALWRDLWSTPQAVQWEKLGWTRVVARYALKLLASEHPKASAILLGEVRQIEDRLGLTPKAMRSLQWEVVDDLGEAADDDDRSDGNVVDMMARMR